MIPNTHIVVQTGMVLGTKDELYIHIILPLRMNSSRMQSSVFAICAFENVQCVNHTLYEGTQFEDPQALLLAKQICSSLYKMYPEPRETLPPNGKVLPHSNTDVVQTPRPALPIVQPYLC